MNLPVHPNEISAAALKRLVQERALRKEPVLIMFITPLCGTCKVALRMLEVVEAMDPSLKVYRCNVNTAPELAQLWRISSVPALASVVHGNLDDVLYKMESVEGIFRFLQSHRLIRGDGSNHG